MHGDNENKGKGKLVCVFREQIHETVQLVF